MIPGTVTGKFCKFKGIQKYSGRGRFADFKGTDVVVLESNERKRSIILFFEPLLLLLDGNSNDLAYGRLPVGYIEKYRSGEPTEIPNLNEGSLESGKGSVILQQWMLRDMLSASKDIFLK